MLYTLILQYLWHCMAVCTVSWSAMHHATCNAAARRDLNLVILWSLPRQYLDDIYPGDPARPQSNHQSRRARLGCKPV
ncbi:hypothetical protein F5Y01DRAFT_288313 [Xylaria sp. FL0043]|nr:hypothetical protein F5Y01DRAFT_288313 [Xylaria sp. FL0043]